MLLFHLEQRRATVLHLERESSGHNPVGEGITLEFRRLVSFVAPQYHRRDAGPVATRTGRFIIYADGFCLQGISNGR